MQVGKVELETKLFVKSLGIAFDTKMCFGERTLLTKPPSRKEHHCS